MPVPMNLSDIRGLANPRTESLDGAAGSQASSSGDVFDRLIHEKPLRPGSYVDQAAAAMFNPDSREIPRIGYALQGKAAAPFRFTGIDPKYQAAIKETSDDIEVIRSGSKTFRALQNRVTRHGTQPLKIDLAPLGGVGARYNPRSQSVQVDPFDSRIDRRQGGATTASFVAMEMTNADSRKEYEAIAERARNGYYEKMADQRQKEGKPFVPPAKLYAQDRELVERKGTEVHHSIMREVGSRMPPEADMYSALYSRDNPKNWYTEQNYLDDQVKTGHTQRIEDMYPAFSQNYRSRANR